MATLTTSQSFHLRSATATALSYSFSHGGKALPFTRLALSPRKHLPSLTLRSTKPYLLPRLTVSAATSSLPPNPAIPTRIPTLFDSTRTISALFSTAASISKLFLRAIESASSKIASITPNPSPEDSWSSLILNNRGLVFRIPGLRSPQAPCKRFGPYLCQPVIGGLSDEDKPFICTMDSIGAKLPWSNKYHPLLDEGLYPSPELRKLEIDTNDVFSVYRDQYYEGGISSVYMWEDDNDVFVACFLIKKDGSKYAHGRMGYLNEGKWDAIHVIEMSMNYEPSCL